jgi:D-aminoacyl-tRNA deacylase
MRAVVQRVSHAKVTVNQQVSGEIGVGLLVLLGVGHDDTELDAAYLAEKIAGLRIFPDRISPIASPQSMARTRTER